MAIRRALKSLHRRAKHSFAYKAMRILVVDDMGAMRQTVKRALNSLGFDDTVEAKNGKDAYDVVMANHDIPGKKIDLAIVDWNMAPVSGLDLLKMLRGDGRTKDIIFIMLTAEQMRDNIILALQARVDDYIIKPFTAGTIKEKFDKVTLRELGKIKKDLDEYLGGAEVGLDRDEGGENESRKIEGFRKRYMFVSQISPWSYYTAMELGKMYLRFGKYDLAEKWLRNVISINFGIAEAHNLLSKVLRAQGKIPESIDELKIAVVEKPSSGELRQKLGEAYLKEGRLDAAIEELSESLKLLDQTKDRRLAAKSKTSLGRAKDAKGEKDEDGKLKAEAIEDMREAMSLDPDYLAASYNLMVAYRKAGRESEALGIFESIKDNEPKTAEGWVALGKAFLDEAEKSKAFFAFGRADALSENRFEIYEEISAALFKNKNFDEALRYLEKAKEINPSDFFSYNLCGIIHRMTDNHAAAIKDYQKASQLDPDNAGVFFNLGVAYYKIGDEQKSVGNFKKARGIDPSLPELDHYMKLLGIS